MICNICGKELDMWDKQEDFTLNREIGYGSNYDGSQMELHICCECMDKIINNCAISPITES